MRLLLQVDCDTPTLVKKHHEFPFASVTVAILESWRIGPMPTFHHCYSQSYSHMLDNFALLEPPPWSSSLQQCYYSSILLLFLSISICQHGSKDPQFYADEQDGAPPFTSCYGRQSIKSGQTRRAHDISLFQSSRRRLHVVDVFDMKTEPSEPKLTALGCNVHHFQHFFLSTNLSLEWSFSSASPCPVQSTRLTVDRKRKLHRPTRRKRTKRNHKRKFLKAPIVTIDTPINCQSP